MKRSMTMKLAAAAVFLTTPLLTTTAKAADIVDTAVANGNFKTLAAALGAADLVGALKGDGPFTVFAPTDEAFSKLPAGTVETLLQPENKEKLKSILTYHVVAKQVPASTVVTLSGATTLMGERASIRTENGAVKVNDATVVITDIACDNGLIHVIDSVLLPADKNLVETAASAGTFNTLIAAAKAAGLAGALTGPDNLTVFAPTDEAFAKLPAGTVESLLKPENKQKLVSILKYHVVPGRVYSDAALAARNASTLEGGSVSITADANGAKVNSANLVATDLNASNGVIHVIDSVLMPPANNNTSCNGEACQAIASAIAHGAPLYNAGHHGACADLYMGAFNQLMNTDLAPRWKNHMSTVLSAAKTQHSSTDRAWTMRRGMDLMYTSLQTQR